MIATGGAVAKNMFLKNSHGAKGYRLESMNGFLELLDEAVNSDVPVLIDVPIDYSDNRELFISLNDAKAN